MKETVFLINALKEWRKKFEGIHVRYAYDAASEYHIVEVDPESIRRGNDEYKKAEISLWDSFAKTFPESDLLISEPWEGNDMTNCLYDSAEELQKGEQYYLLDLPKVNFPWEGYVVVLQDESPWQQNTANKETNEYQNNYEYALAA